MWAFRSRTVCDSLAMGLLLFTAVAPMGCRGCDEAAKAQLAGASAKPSAAVRAPAAPLPRPDGGRGGGNRTQQSFSTAKHVLLGIYADHPHTLYCNCGYRVRRIVLAGCGYRPRRHSARAERLEWEHAVPAEAFGHSFTAWRQGHPDCVGRRGKPYRGRKCARKVSAAFRLMEADMYNLYPAVGEINEARSNFSFGLIAGEERAFGGCDFEVAERKVEPRPAVRGDIARTYLYMNAAFPGRGILSSKSRKLMQVWAAADPVDAWECQRARRIAQVQGNANAVLSAACRAAGH